MIVGINEIGHEVGNPLITRGRDLPWLQDTPEQQVWTRWGVDFRDVVVLDEHNVRVGTLNLTRHDLGRTENLDKLKALLRQAKTHGQAKTRGEAKTHGQAKTHGEKKKRPPPPPRPEPQP